MNKGARVFLVYWNDLLVGFNSILNMPSGTSKGAFREHRLVILPDFQGLGFGTRVSEFIGDYLVKQGYKYFSRSTHIRLGRHRTSSNLWTPTATNQVLRSNLNKDNEDTTQGSKYRTLDDKRVAYSFEYVGEDYSNKEHHTIVCNGDTDYETATQMIDDVIDMDKYPIIVSGIASIKEITVWEKIASERGIRHEVLRIKRKGEFHFNKSSIGNSEFDAILISKQDRDIIDEYKTKISKCITCYDTDESKFYIFEKGEGIKKYHVD